MNEQNTAEHSLPLPENEQRQQRLHKLEILQAEGIDPFREERCERTHTASQLTSPSAPHWLLSEEERAAMQCVAAGRLTAHRSKGKVVFADITDETGRVQVYVRRDDVGEEKFEQFLQLDLGDILSVNGYPFHTRTGEPTLHVRTHTLMAKALRSAPIGKKDEEGVVHSGLTDKERRYRYRYLDMLANSDSREALVKRSQMVSAMRRFLDEKGFLEVETPMLQHVAGGAAARPFLTHHNALNFDFKLRISLELYLKKLLVGGLEKVYEIGRVFRNEGISTRHSPEFTLMELYQAYANLEDIMALVEEMFAALCQKLNGTEALTWGEHTIEFGKPWQRLPMLEGIRTYAGIEPEELASLESAHAACRRIGVPFDIERETLLGGLIEKLHEIYTQPNLIQPVFITDFPIETSPLAKKHPHNPALTRRFEAYAATQELGNAFSELNDPLDQRARFEEQMRQRAAGDEEAHPMDEDFLLALEYGMPPAGGLGIGLDRLALLFTGAETLRDVIFFPLMRPEH